MSPSGAQRGAQTVLALRFLRAVRTGALVGLVPGVLAGLVIVVTAAGPLAGAALVGSLMAAVVGFVLGLTLCASAFLASYGLSRLGEGASPLADDPLKTQRGLMGTGGAGSSAALVVLAVMLWQADRLS